MLRILAPLALILATGCAASHAVANLPASPACDYAEPLAPYCLEIVGDDAALTCYGADAAEHDNGSIVCVWRCVPVAGMVQDVYAVFNPIPTMHLDTMIATGPAAPCD